MSEHKSHIVIVGAGLAGLTAAVYLSKAGYEVLLLEKNMNCGGLLNSFKHEGFTFDAGAHSIENAGIIRPMLSELDIQLDLIKSKVSLGIDSKIINFDSKNSLNEYGNLLKMLYPSSSKEINKIMRRIWRIVKDMNTIYGFDNPIFKDFKNNKKYLIQELIPWSVKFLPAVLRMNRMNEPIENFLNGISQNASLNDIIDQHFFKNTPLFFALGYFYVYRDYIYPKGGTGKLAEKLEEKLLKLGATIKTGTRIKKISPASHTITDDNANEYHFDKLIWCSDLKSLYKDLDISDMDSTTISEISCTKEKLLSKRGGDSVFSLFMGIDQEVEYFSTISNGHFFYTPEKKGLGQTHRNDLQSLISNFDVLDKEEIYKWLEKFCKYNTYEISIPAIRDSSLAPEGKTGLRVSLLFEYDLIKKIKDAGWYDEFKIKLEDMIINVMENSIYPNIKKNIIFRISSSPLSIERIAGTSEGGITGWSYEQRVPVVNNLLKMTKSITTPIPDVLQAGQWAYSPAGIPTAILTGWYAADSIIKNHKQS